jgi:hypothetical protein
MAILTYIDGFPVFSKYKEALDYGLTVNVKGVHVHRYKLGPNNYRSGYMIANTHKELKKSLSNKNK